MSVMLSKMEQLNFKRQAFESAEHHREDAKSERKEKVSLSYFVSLLSLLLLRFACFSISVCVYREEIFVEEV